MLLVLTQNTRKFSTKTEKWFLIKQVSSDKNIKLFYTQKNLFNMRLQVASTAAKTSVNKNVWYDSVAFRYLWDIWGNI